MGEVFPQNPPLFSFQRKNDCRNNKTVFVTCDNARAKQNLAINTALIDRVSLYSSLYNDCLSNNEIDILCEHYDNIAKICDIMYAEFCEYVFSKKVVSRVLVWHFDKNAVAIDDLLLKLIKCRFKSASTLKRA